MTGHPRKLSNAACWKEAQRFLVGGVNSPVRSFRAVGGNPFFVDRGDGAYLWDVEGNRYIDYVCSWGALILGHRPERVLRAARKAMERGTTFGTPTPGETALAREISAAVPSMERVRFVCSGTEAAMSALRLARGATGKQAILKFDGAYHGHSDALLAKAGSGMATMGISSSAGVPLSVTEHTITVPFNDEEAVGRALRYCRGNLACIIVEPVMANAGLIPPKKGFLKFLRKVTRKAGALLIFDEVITGFRVARGGAQALYGVTPDLTILGKVIGGGFPIGAYGGPKRLMRHVAPLGPVYQAGTLAGHPVAMAAGLATLEELKQPKVYEQLERKARRLKDGLMEACRQKRIQAQSHQVGSLTALFFTENPVMNAKDARVANVRRYARYFRGMLERGIYLPPSAFETWFLSTAHGEKELKLTLDAHRAVVAQL